METDGEGKWRGGEREEMEEGNGKGDRGNERDGTGFFGETGRKGREEGREREMGYSPQTSIPGAATGFTAP